MVKSMLEFLSSSIQYQHLSLFTQVAHLITDNQRCRRMKRWHFSVWPSDTRSRQTAHKVSGWIKSFLRLTWSLAAQNKLQIRIQYRLCTVKMCTKTALSLLIVMVIMTLTYCKKLTHSRCASNLSFCDLDPAESFCGCYLGQSRVGWRFEEAQTGKHA